MADANPLTVMAKLRVARRLTYAGLWAERIARAFWPFWSVLITVLAALSFGLHDLLPDLPLLVLTGLAGALGLGSLVWGLRAFQRPRIEEAEARIDAQMVGQPLATLRDSQALGQDDPASAALWQAHLARMAAQAAKARAAAPDLRLASRDPFALRYVALTAFVMALIFGSAARLATVTAIDTGADAAAAGPMWEAWAQPPAYTGKPTIYLNETPEDILQLPKGTRLQFRLYGESGDITVSETVSGKAAAADGAEAEMTRDFEVARSGMVAVGGDGGREWQVTVLPDSPPKIIVEGDIGREADGRFRQGFAVEDDYGVVAGRVTITLDLPAVDRRYGLITEPEPREAVVLDLPMPVTGDRAKFAETLIDDLSQHPFANLPVTMVFTAEDAAGQTGEAPPISVTLPGKRFFDPLAAALIELRRDILWNRSNAPRSAQILRAVTNAPEGFIRNERAYLRLRVLMRQLNSEAAGLSPEKRDEMAEELWQIALMVEEGDLQSAMERLQRAQDRLDEAIKNGASPEEIDELMQEMQQALNEYMRELAEEAERNPDSQMSQNMEGMQMSGDQLQEMLDELQRLMEEGKTAEAQELMEMLRQLMQNMQVVQGQGQGQGQGNQSMQGLNETLRDQQELSDDSFRDMQEGQQGQDQQGQEGPSGEEGQEQQGQGGQQGLAERQRELRDRLGQLGQQPLPGEGTEQGEAGRQELDRAGRAMRDAEEALRNGDLPEAMDRQAEAMEAMREGMRNFGEAMAEAERQENGEGGNQEVGQADPNAPRDPLGREPGNAARIGSDENMLQGEDVYRRAQDILDEIRRRSGDQTRPESERDYLRRLLDTF